MAKQLVHMFTFVAITVNCISNRVATNEMPLLELDARNFDDVITGQRFAIVEFYAPWCGACKRFAPTYQEIADHFSDRYDVIVAKVDAFKEKELSKRFKVSGFPTLKYFAKGSTESTPVKGTNKKKIISLIESNVDKSDSAMKSPVFIITTHNLTLSLQNHSDRIMMVELYHPSVEECRKLYPVFERIAAIFSKDRSIVFGRINLGKESEQALKSLFQRFHVIRLPTYLWIVPGKQHIKLFPGNDVKMSLITSLDLLNFINQESHIWRSIDGALMDNAGYVNKIDHLFIEFLSDILAGNMIPLIQSIQEIIPTISTPLDKQYGEYYMVVLQKVNKDGFAFVQQEANRLDKLLGGKLSSEKEDDFTRKRNILRRIISLTGGNGKNSHGVQSTTERGNGAMEFRVEL